MYSMFTADTIPGDSILKWEPYKEGDNVISRFNLGEWNKIAFDIDTEYELLSLCYSYYHRIQGCVLYENRKNKPIAFLYILKDSASGNIVSIHGGGWNVGICYSFYYYRGVILMIKALLTKGFKVRTSCLTDNYRALRFLNSLGFVKYKTLGNVVKMWINATRLCNSRIYKRIYK